VLKQCKSYKVPVVIPNEKRDYVDASHAVVATPLRSNSIETTSNTHSSMQALHKVVLAVRIVASVDLSEHINQRTVSSLAADMCSGHARLHSKQL
jgi:hypothetical protein